MRRRLPECPISTQQSQGSVWQRAFVFLESDPYSFDHRTRPWYGNCGLDPSRQRKHCSLALRKGDWRPISSGEPTRWRFCITLLHALLFPKVWIFLWLGVLSTRKCFSNKALQSVHQTSLYSASYAYNLQHARDCKLIYSASLHLFKQHSLVHESIEYRMFTLNELKKVKNSLPSMARLAKVALNVKD